MQDKHAVLPLRVADARIHSLALLVLTLKPILDAGALSTYLRYCQSDCSASL